MLSLPKNHRTWLLRGVVALLGLTVALLVAAALWGLLCVLGDETGAGVARCVVGVAGSGWLAVLAALVLLLAWERLAERDGDRRPLEYREGEAPAEPNLQESQPFDAAPRARRPPTTPVQAG